MIKIKIMIKSGEASRENVNGYPKLELGNQRKL